MPDDPIVRLTAGEETEPRQSSITYGRGPEPKRPPTTLKPSTSYRLTESGQHFLTLRPKQPPVPSFEDIQEASPFGLPPDWDYRIAELGPHGEQQLPYQQGWDPHGRPYYGPGILGYLTGVASRLQAPIEETPALEEIDVDLQRVTGPLQYIPGVNQIAFLAQNLPTITSAADVLVRRASNLGREPGTEVGLNISSVPTLIGRGASEFIRGGLALLQQPAIMFERYVGGTALALEELAGVAPEREPASPIFFEEGTRLGSIETAMRNLYLPNIHPIGMAVNAFRSGINVGFTKKPLDEVVDTLDLNLNAARILYTSAIDPMARENFIRRVQAGENPDLLAMELENPIAEAVGQTLFDPLNLIAAGTAKARDARQIRSVADEYIKVADDGVRSALDNLGSLRDRVFVVSPGGEATIVDSVDDLVRAKMASTVKVRAGLDDFARDTSAFALVTEGKRFHVARRAEEMAAWIAHNTSSADETLEIYRGLQLAASDDPQKVALGIDILNNFKAPRPLYSRAGEELGILLDKVMGESPEKFLSGLKKAAGDGDIAKLVEFAEKKMGPVIDGMFPTIAERVKAGEDINPIIKGLARYDNLFRSNVMQPVNQFFASIYMGMTPGYAFRNFLTNTLHILVDEGWRALRFRPSTWQSKSAEWLGGRLPKAFGFGAVSAANLKPSRRVWNTFLKLSENLESGARAQVIGHSIDNTMRSLMRPGRAIPDVKPLTDAGLSTEMTQVLQRMFLDHKGNVPAIKKAFAQAAKTGSVETFRQLGAWASPEDIAALERLGLYDDAADALRAADPDAGSAILQQALQDIRDEAANVADEVAHVSQESEFLEDAVALGEARDAGFLSNQTVKATQSRFVAAENANFNYRYAVDEFKDQVLVAIGRAGPEKITLPDGRVLTVQQAANEVLTKYRPVLGGIQAEGIVNRRKFWQKIFKYRDDINSLPADTSWDGIWRRIGIPGDPPPGLTKDTLKHALFDEYARPTVDKMAQAARDSVALTSETFAKELGALVGIEPNTALFQKARESYLVSHTFDNSAVFKDDRIYRFGPFEVSSGEGINHQRHALNAINANLPPGVDKFDSIWDVPPAIGRQALEKRVAARAEDVLQAAKEVAPEELAAKGFSEEVVEQMLEGKIEVPEVVIPGSPLAPERRMSFADARAELDRLEEAARSGRAYEGVAAQDQAIFEAELKAFREGVRVAEAEVAQMAEITKEAMENLIPPYARGSTPSHSRAWAENLDGIEELFARLDEGMRANWGTSRPIVVNDEVEAALKVFFKEAEGNVAEARLLASQVANARADFTLLLYPEKRNIDMALQYIYPYHFWYNRTYINWLRRTVSNPNVLAAYGRYRQTLEKIHAGAPEWWKYNINSDELLGIETDHPLFFNLEQTLNPLQGLVGVDFDDPVKRTGWFTAALQEANKLGPSTWTPLSLVTALALYIQGEDEAAERWAGVLIPQTTTLRTTATLATGQPVAANLPYFLGGMGPFERRRVGRAIASMDNENIYPTADLTDAAFNQKGPLWDKAIVRQATERGPGQLASFLLGVGFKARTRSDMQIDQFYTDYYSFWAQEPNYSPEEIRNGLEALRQKYPFMDTLLLSRKGGLDRDRAYAYNVLARIPPAQSDDFAELVGVDPRLLSRFYEEKGHIEKWPESDRDRFMSAIIDLGAVIDIPREATRAEWNAARNAYNTMLESGKAQFGDNIWDRVDAYFGAKTDEAGGGEVAESILANDPAIGAALDWRSLVIMRSPTMAAYYTSIEKVESYYKGRMYDAIEKELGEDIWLKWDVWHFLRDTGQNKEANAFWKANPELERYGDLKDAWLPLVAQKAIQIGQLLPEGIGAAQRDIEGEMGLGAQDVLGNFPQVGPGEITLELLHTALGESGFNLLLDAFEGELIPGALESKLEEIAQSLGITVDDMISRIGATEGIESPQPAPPQSGPATGSVSPSPLNLLATATRPSVTQGAEGALPSPPAYEGGGGMQLEGDFEGSPQQPIVRLTAGEETIGRQTIDRTIAQMKEVFPGIKDSAYEKAGEAFENPNMYERGSRFDPEIAAGGFAHTSFVDVGQEVAYSLGKRTIPRAIEVADARDLSVFIHEMAHQLDLVGPYGRRTSMSKEFTRALDEFLRNPTSDSTAQAQVIRLIQEFPGIGGNPMAEYRLFINDPERTTGWGGPVELYASMMASAGGDLRRIPPQFKKFFDAFMEDAPPRRPPAEVVPEGAYAEIEAMLGTEATYVIGENIGVSQRTGDLMVSDEALAEIRRVAKELGLPPHKTVEDVLRILGIDF